MVEQIIIIIKKEQYNVIKTGQTIETVMDRILDPKDRNQESEDKSGKEWGDFLWTTKKKTEGDLTMNNDTGIKYAYEELNKLALQRDNALSRIENMKKNNMWIIN